ncbi:Na+/H+ antiporter [Actinoallomurus rhizosphaericola]|uniref:Na+/H+ antiporter n=1 Tax=Actinoallomurus rhizosphaericola TaxID=2952536 RepID=UPI002092A9BB|nr:Na+/H+ antiporter [Actinoallomurus rhizosphaericola]
MGPMSLFLGGLAFAVVVLLARNLAGRLGLPEATLLVVLAAAMGFIPGMPQIHLPPEIVLIGFLPPIVYHAAFFTAPREAKADAVPIITLAVALTTVTTFAAAGAAHAVVTGLSWAAAIAFGAAVAPTDAVSATSILQRLGAPRRIVTILEGESLINDGVALTVFVLAVEGLSHSYTYGHGAARLVEVVVGGVTYGLLVGFAVSRLRRRIRDPSSQIVVSLLTPYLAFIPADELGFSGILATVTAGFFLGTRGEGMLQPASRLVGGMFWRVLVYLLESALFVLLGLQIRPVMREITGHSPSRLLVAVLVVATIIIAVRIAWSLWVFPLGRYLPGRHLEVGHLNAGERFAIGWSGMRGAISLAIVLSVPGNVRGSPLPGRQEMVFLTAAIVFVTLVGQAMALPVILRRFGLAESDRQRIEQMTARRAVLEAALDRLDALVEKDEVDERAAQTYRQLYEDRLRRVRAELDGDADEEAPPDPIALRRDLIRAQRERLDRLYRKGKISADAVRAVRRRLDLDDPDLRRDVGLSHAARVTLRSSGMVRIGDDTE